MRRVLLLATLALTVACESRPPEFGVSVFSNDTVQVVFTVSLAESLVMGLRSEQFQMQADKSLLMTTPAELVIQRGIGSATIRSVQGGALVVKPIGPVDSLTQAEDTAAVTGRVVLLRRPDERRVVRLTVERPE